jgi:hypothetical protein
MCLLYNSSLRVRASAAVLRPSCGASAAARAPAAVLRPCVCGLVALLLPVPHNSSLSSATRVQARTDGPSRSRSSGRGMWYTFLAAPLPGACAVGPACAVRKCRPYAAFVGQRLVLRQMRRFFTGAFVHRHVSLRTGSL